MRCARMNHRSEVHLAVGEANLADHVVVNKNFGVGIKIFDIENDAAAGPIRGDGDGAFVPGALHVGKIGFLPA